MSKPSLDPVSDAMLLDGTTVSLRRLNSSNYDDTIGLYGTLTDDDRYRRFFTMHPAHVPAWARSLTQRSKRQYALGAFDAGRLIGVANYTVGTTPGQAEVAVVVAHSAHMRGVGTALLHRLGEVALKNGIDHFEADILAANHPMLTVITDAGWPYTRQGDGPELHIEVNLRDVC